MSDGFKAWGSIFLCGGIIGLIIWFFGGADKYLIFAISGLVIGISFFINASFCKILEDTRDTLKRIEDFMKNENKTE